MSWTSTRESALARGAQRLLEPGCQLAGARRMAGQGMPEDRRVPGAQRSLTSAAAGSRVLVREARSSGSASFSSTASLLCRSRAIAAAAALSAADLLDSAEPGARPCWRGRPG